MPKQMSAAKLKRTEQQAFDVMKKIWSQSKDKKALARIITFAVIGFAVYQELFIESHLSNNWCEVTVYLLMGYFGMATFRSVFRM